jgi:hypothetical protein
MGYDSVIKMNKILSLLENLMTIGHSVQLNKSGTKKQIPHFLLICGS